MYIQWLSASTSMFDYSCIRKTMVSKAFYVMFSEVRLLSMLEAGWHGNWQAEPKSGRAWRRLLRCSLATNSRWPGRLSSGLVAVLKERGNELSSN